jgi:hypothetical protein
MTNLLLLGHPCLSRQIAVRSQAKDSRRAMVEQSEFDGELSEQESRLPL